MVFVVIAFRTGDTIDLLRDPPKDVPTRTRKDLVKDENDLNEEDETQIASVLSAIKRHVEEHDLDLYPYFKDFDRKSGFTKGVTRPQFRRLLDMTLRMPISEHDVTLLCEKYLNRNTGHVNYHKFIADVDDACNLKPKEQYFDVSSWKMTQTLQEALQEKEKPCADITAAINAMKYRWFFLFFMFF